MTKKSVTNEIEKREIPLSLSVIVPSYAFCIMRWVLNVITVLFVITLLHSILAVKTYASRENRTHDV